MAWYRSSIDGVILQLIECFASYICPVDCFATVSKAMQHQP